MDLDESFNRAKFELICDDDVFSKLTECIDEALEDAGLDSENITHIVMVGDYYYCHIPIVKKYLVDYFDRDIIVSQPVNPNEIIAIGASIICDKLSNGISITDNIQIHEKKK